MPGFLKLLLSVCVCVCVHPQAINNYLATYVNESQITNQTSPTAFQFLYMILAVDIITDGRGLSNEACHELLPR